MEHRSRSASPDARQLSAEPGKISAYYSLVFPHFTFYIQTLDVSIGRRTVPSPATPSTSAPVDQVDVDLGAVKSVSRLHARIEYDQEADKFVLAVIGRNGAWVDGVWAASGTRALLGDRSHIQIASRTFDFVLPPPPPPEDSPSPSSSSGDRARSPTLDVTSISPPASLPSRSPPPHQPPPPLPVKAPPDPMKTNGAPKAKSKKRKKSDTSTNAVPISSKSEVEPSTAPLKPNLTYSQLIYKALKGIGENATLQDICNWIMNAYDFYKVADNRDAWTSSIRHNLSSCRAFKKLERCGSERGRGFLWCIDETVEHNLEEPEARPSDGASAGTSLNGEAKEQKGKSKRGDTTKSAPLPPPLTYTPRPIASATQSASNAPQPPATPATGVFAYGYNGNANQNAYSSINWNSTQPKTTVNIPNSTAQAPEAPGSTSGQTSEQTPASLSTSSKAGSAPISIQIVLGPVPPHHPEYSPSHPNNSKTEGYIVWDGQGKLILDPTVFGSLSKETINEYERMGAQSAVIRLSKQAARARRGKAAGRGKARPKGATPTSGERKATATYSQVAAAGVSLKNAPSTNETLSSGGLNGKPAQDESSVVNVVDDSDEEKPASKRRKLDEVTSAAASQVHSDEKTQVQQDTPMVTITS